jgi:Na+/proline symporter
MSDVGILNDPASIIVIILLFGSPGLLLGIPGALLWRKHRIIGALVGGVAGFILWLMGWMVYKDMI